LNDRDLNVTGADGRPAARPGTDHGWFHWSAVVDRPHPTWPDSASVAVAVIVDLGAVEWERGGLFPVRPPGGRGFAAYPDVPRMSHREFGHRVGIFRLLAMLERVGIAPAVAVDVLTVEEYPGLMDHIEPAAGELLAHGLSASRPITGAMGLDEEIHYISSTLKRLEARLGVRPDGWMGAQQGESARTPALLADAGVRYVADWANDEQPYVMDGAAAGLWSLPVSWELCDLNAVHLRDVSPTAYAASIVEAFDVLSDEARQTPRLLVLHLHPWLTGQAFRLAPLEGALRHIAASTTAWIATPGQIIDQSARDA
jgi:allantoinase